MKILFLGTVADPATLKGRAASVAGNKMQYHLLHYLSEYPDVDIRVISFRPHAAFPKEKKVLIRKTEETLFGKIPVRQEGYINLPFIKQFSLTHAFLRSARKYVDSETVLFAYDLYPIQGLPLRRVKKRVGGKTVSLLADLSIGGVDSRAKGLRALARRLYDRSTLRNVAACDHFIVLNSYVADTYAPDKDYLLTDGGVEPSEYPVTAGWDGKMKTILYTGALLDYSGILNLIEAMKHVKANGLELVIYGDGLLRGEVERLAAEMPNVTYRGTVTNREILEIQQKSWLLVNPRPTGSLIAKVTFPSKIFEYLMSGRPVLTTRLNGFDKVYDDLLFWADGETPEALAASIDRIADMGDDALTARAAAAKQYLLEHKTWKHNAENVYAFLKKIGKEEKLTK